MKGFKDIRQGLDLLGMSAWMLLHAYSHGSDARPTEKKALFDTRA